MNRKIEEYYKQKDEEYKKIQDEIETVETHDGIIGRTNKNKYYIQLLGTYDPKTCVWTYSWVHDGSSKGYEKLKRKFDRIRNNDENIQFYLENPIIVTETGSYIPKLILYLIKGSGLMRRLKGDIELFYIMIKK